jgi:hypothetical protein
MKGYPTMWPFIVNLLFAFALGYGVREMISRRRRKKYFQQHLEVGERLNPNELKLQEANLAAIKGKRRRKRTKTAVRGRELKPHTSDMTDRTSPLSSRLSELAGAKHGSPVDQKNDSNTVEESIRSDAGTGSRQYPKMKVEQVEQVRNLGDLSKPH